MIHEYNNTKTKTKINHTKENDKNTSTIDTGKDDTRQVWQPYFHSGPSLNRISRKNLVFQKFGKKGAKIGQNDQNQNCSLLSESLVTKN